MMRRRLMAAAATFVLVGGYAAGAFAQQGPAGQWRCRETNQSLSNNAFENWMYEFILALDANGGFQAQGNYIAQTAGYAVPFMAQGRWGQQQGGIVVQGGEQRQDGTTAQFILLFSIISDRSMSNQYQSPGGKLLTYCER